MADPFAFFEASDADPYSYKDVVQPRGVVELPRKKEPQLVLVKARIATRPTAGERLAKSEKFYREVAKADGSEVSGFMSDVLSWAGSGYCDAMQPKDRAAAQRATEEREEHDAPGDDADEPTVEPAPAPKRTFSEEKAAFQAAKRKEAVELAGRARAAELKAGAAAKAEAEAKAKAAAKLAKLTRVAEPLGTIDVKPKPAQSPQLSRSGTIVGGQHSSTPAPTRKRKKLQHGRQAEAAAGGSAVKQTARVKKQTAPQVKKQKLKKVAAGSDPASPAGAPASARKKSRKAKSRQRSAAEWSAAISQPFSPGASSPLAAPASEVRSTARPTRRGRNSIAPVAWWTAAGGAEASKRRLTSASLKQAEAVSIARVL